MGGKKERRRHFRPVRFRPVWDPVIFAPFVFAPFSFAPSVFAPPVFAPPVSPGSPSDESALGSGNFGPPFDLVSRLPTWYPASRPGHPRPEKYIKKSCALRAQLLVFRPKKGVGG